MRPPSFLASLFWLVFKFGFRNFVDWFRRPVLVWFFSLIVSLSPGTIFDIGKLTVLGFLRRRLAMIWKASRGLRFLRIVGGSFRCGSLRNAVASTWFGHGSVCYTNAYLAGLQAVHVHVQQSSRSRLLLTALGIEVIVSLRRRLVWVPFEIVQRVEGRFSTGICYFFLLHCICALKR